METTDDDGVASTKMLPRRRTVFILVVFVLLGLASLLTSWQSTSQTLSEFQKSFHQLRESVVASLVLEPSRNASQSRFIALSETTLMNVNLSEPTINGTTVDLLVHPVAVTPQPSPVDNHQFDGQLSDKAGIDAFQQPSVSASRNASLLDDDDDRANLANKSSIDFVAYFGAGHRLNRMSFAYYLSDHLGLGFRTFWGVCTGKEIFSYLFGPQPMKDLRKVTSENQFRVFINIVLPGPANLRRFVIRKNNASIVPPCMCSTPAAQEKTKADVRLYHTMRDRFRARDKIEEFRQEHFTNASLVIGMHVRAGNGEKEHFVDANRTIANESTWIRQVAKHVRSLAKDWRRDTKAKDKNPAYELHPVTLFLATDTASMIQRFQDALQNDTIQVVVWNQDRREEGGGVLFGDQKTHQKGDQCLPGWEATFADMILLSYADILVAPRSSSFTQTLPMSLAYAGRQERQQQVPKDTQLPPAFCEMNYEATEMRCFHSFMEWCCEGEHEFTGHEHLEVPDSNFSNFQYNLLPRPVNTNRCIGRRFGARFEVNCLPFDYSFRGW